LELIVIILVLALCNLSVIMGSMELDYVRLVLLDDLDLFVIILALV